MSRFGDEEITNAGQPHRPSSDKMRAPPRFRGAPAPACEGDLAELVGQLMAKTIATERRLEVLSRDVETLSREIHQNTQAVSQDRGALSHATAKHASNRMAALMGALFTLYEITSPYLREIWRQAVHR